MRAYNNTTFIFIYDKSSKIFLTGYVIIYADIFNYSRWGIFF